MNDEQLLRYSRHIFLPELDIDGQQAICGARLLVVGLGGLGCAALPYLVASGIGRITLVDDDHVELSNLPRQILHTHEDRNSTRLNSSHVRISYAVFCLKKKKNKIYNTTSSL